MLPEAQVAALEQKRDDEGFVIDWSDPTIVLLIAVLGLNWQARRWMQRLEAGLQTVGERIDGLRRALEEPIDAHGTALQGKIDGEFATLLDELRAQRAETRQLLDELLLRVGSRGRP